MPNLNDIRKWDGSQWSSCPCPSDGAQGPQGPKGDAGDTGLTGPQGPAGSVSACWPVGSVFVSVVDTDPATLLGFGTWVSIGSGQVLVGKNASDTDFDTLEKTGGEKTHTLTVTEMPAHTHVQDAHNHTQDAHTHTQNSHTHPSIQVQGGTSASTSGTHIMTSVATGGSSRAATSPELANAATATNQNTTATNQATTATNQNTGGGGAHNNVQPYLVVRFWKRTA